MDQQQPHKHAALVTVGFPDSGKTTFLAALWHLLVAADIETELELVELRAGEQAHLNEIAQRWRAARVQDRTPLSRPRLTEMSLRNDTGQPVRLVFPDVAGEAYRQIWEGRECDEKIADMLMSDAGVLLFIHADTILFPNWISDHLPALEQEAASAGGEAAVQEWDASLAPTQVKTVDLLAVMAGSDGARKPRRLAILFSAWDKAEHEGLAPREFLAAKMPLLDQYLRHNADCWEVRVYGVSAQGCDYDAAEASQRSPAALEILAQQNPSSRIRLVHANVTTHDLTGPLVWLMG